jgi:hypothetical protein
MMSAAGEAGMSVLALWAALVIAVIAIEQRVAPRVRRAETWRWLMAGLVGLTTAARRTPSEAPQERGRQN